MCYRFIILTCLACNIYCLDLLNYSDDKKLNDHEKELIAHVQKSIYHAENGFSKNTPEILLIEGMSSSKVRHFLNNVCSMPNVHYLEIGTWLGSTWISALYENKENIASAIAVDNWSKFGGSEGFRDNCNRYLKDRNFKMICDDCFTIDLQNFSKRVNVYFYDGDHSYNSQEKAFTYFDKIFDDVFIAIVDDWNWTPVVEGTYSAFKKLNYEILFETHLPACANCDILNWWNGLYVAVIRRTNIK